MFPDFFKHVHWDKLDGKHQPKTARIACEACGCVWSEGDRLNALKTVRWHQARSFDHCGSRHSPLDAYDRAWRDGDGAVEKVWDWWESGRHAVYRARCPDCGVWGVDNEHAGFQASKLFSPWQKDKPSDIATKWLAAKGDPDKEQAWWNTQMGLPFRAHSGKELRLEALAARGEVWDCEVPDGVVVITVGIDTQDYRVEIETVGWGRNEESWSLDYEIIEGEFSDPGVQAQLDAYLKRIWRLSDGRGLAPMGACIDSGGHHTQAVYDFAKARLGRRIWAIKGESARSGQRSPVWPTKRPSSRNKASFRPVILGVNAAKDTIRSRLHLEAPGAGYMHFPSDRDINYFAQLTSERLTLKSVGGHKYRVWELPPGKANEALDTRVYAYGALCGLLHLGLKLNKRADAAGHNNVSHETVVAQPVAAQPVAATSEPQAEPRAEKKSIVSRLA